MVYKVDIVCNRGPTTRGGLKSKGQLLSGEELRRVVFRSIPRSISMLRQLSACFVQKPVGYTVVARSLCTF